MNASVSQLKVWPIVRLGDVAEMCLGKMLDAQKNKGRAQPYLRNPNVRWFEFDLADVQMMRFEEHEDRRYGLQTGDVLVCEGGEAGRAAIWDGRVPGMKFQKAIHRVRCGPRLDNRFLVHRLMADYFSGRLADYYTGTTIHHLTGQDLARYSFALPPLSEQRRIAAILDKADALRAKRRAALAEIDSLTQSIFMEMFGDPVANPKAWQVRQLRDVVREGTIVTYGIVQAGEEWPGGVPYIRTGDIVDGEIARPGLRHTDPKIAAKFARSRIDAGDIVMSIRATVGTTALVPPELDGANLTQGTARISPGDCVEGLYLLHFLRSAGSQRWIGLQVKGATFREITLARLRELPVMVPHIAVQREFAQRVQVGERMSASQRSSLAELDSLFASLQHRAFRGEL